ncbi:MAG: hypothetical protein HUU35_17450, partial [Armatimonadetes bacterium]|nr:hypothetical protein [Armatimonadota bacterium]
MTVRPRPTWSGRETVAWALLGALALALAWLLLPESSPIWLFPAVLVMLAARASRQQLLVAWLLLLLGGLPLLVLGGGGRGVMMAACLGLDLAVTLVVLRYLLSRGNALLVALGAACLRVTLELLWSHTPVGEALTWGLFVVELAPLAEVMDFGGASAGSAVVVLVSSGLGLLLADHERPYALRTVALNLGLLALLLGIGLDRIERPGGTPVRVAAIGAPGQEVRRLVALTERAAAAS